MSTQADPSKPLFFITRYANIFLALGLLICILLPDFVINALLKSERLFWNWLYVLYLAVLCYGLSFLKKRTFYLIWTIFGLLETIQFSHIAYFGIPIFPSAIMAVGHESRDIFDLAYLKHIWFVFPVIGVIYGAGIFLFSRMAPIKHNSKILSFLIVTYTLSLLCTDGLTIRPSRFTKNMQDHANWLLHRCFRQYPSPSLRTTLFTLTCTGIINFSRASTKSYKPYKTLPVPEAARNIILIMGESLSAKRMSLFGYQRKTTPHLDALRDQKEHFFFGPSYSAAPNTKASVLLFFNVLREPDNLRLLETGENNLFRQAQIQGFKTFLITNNDGSRYMGTVENVNSSFVSYAHLHASYPQALQKREDRGLPRVLQELPLSEDKNFIVLHIFSPHSPYKRSYAHENDAFSIYPEEGVTAEEALSNTYDNSVHYVDSVVHEILEVCKKRFAGKGETYVIFTADHAELFGYEDPMTKCKMYAHGHLNLPCVEVPFCFYSLNPIPETVRQKIVKERPAYAAYEVSKFVLSLMGVQLINPNQEDPNLFYVSEELVNGQGNSFAYTITQNGEAIREEKQ